MKEDNMSEKYKKALRIAVNVGCGFEGDAEDAAELLTLITGLESRIAELEAKKDILENQLREATNFLIDKKLHVDSLYEDGFKLQKRIAELEAERRWRIIADGEMPDDRATILAAFKNREILTATYYKRYEGFGGVENYWHIEGWHSGNVTHWMPLPEPPNDTQTDTFVYGKESEE